MKEVNPQDTPRASAFDLWMTSPMPMVTLTKTFDITRIHKASKRKHIKLNALICWCIGKAANQVEEFYMLPVQGKMYQFDNLAINVIVNNKKGGINSCDIPYTNDFNRFYGDYIRLTQSVSESCESIFHRRCHDYRHLGGSSNRTRLHRQPIHRQVSQPNGDVGQIS